MSVGRTGLSCWYCKSDLSSLLGKHTRDQGHVKVVSGLKERVLLAFLAFWDILRNYGRFYLCPAMGLDYFYL